MGVFISTKQHKCILTGIDYLYTMEAVKILLFISILLAAMLAVDDHKKGYNKDRRSKRTQPHHITIQERYIPPVPQKIVYADTIREYDTLIRQ